MPSAAPQAPSYSGFSMSPAPFAGSSDPRDCSRKDHSGTLLDLLADSLGVAPRLWLATDNGPARPNVENFIAKVVMSETMKTRPEVGVGLLPGFPLFENKDNNSLFVPRRVCINRNATNDFKFDDFMQKCDMPAACFHSMSIAY